MEKGGDVESVGRDEGVVLVWGWGEVVVCIRSDGNGLVGLYVDKIGDRWVESLLDRVIDGFDFFLDGVRVVVVEFEYWLLVKW